MRPLKLEVQGFTAFRDLQSIILEDLDLFVITGPTGAGKSSLLDAMVFALFGKVPRMGSQGLSDLISHGIAEARISLDFSIDGTLYRVARRLPRRGATSATFEKSDGTGWASDVEGSGVRAVDRRVIELVKLDFDAFTRAVVLPQGEFQRFLRGEADKRREVLTDLLGLNVYDRMGQRARARVRELEARTRITQEILDNQYADATTDHVSELKTVANFAADRARSLAEAMVTVDGLDKQEAGLRHGRDLLGRRRDELTSTGAGLVEKLASCEQAQSREEELEREAGAAKKRVDEAQTELTRAKELCKALAERHGSLADIAHTQAAVEALTQCRGDLAVQEAHLTALEAELTELATQSRSATEESDKLKSISDAAKQALEEADQAAHAAAATADELSNQLQRAEEAEAEIAEATRDVDRYVGEVAGAQKQADASKRDAEQAENASEQVAHAHAAAVLAHDLKAGDPCPVCHRVLEQAPDVDRHISDAVASASAKRDQARADADTAWRNLTATQTSAKNASDRLERAQASLAEALQGIDNIEKLRTRSAAASTAKSDCSDRNLEARKTAEEAAQNEAGSRVNVATLTTTLANKTAEHKRGAEICDELRKRTATAIKTLEAHFDGGVRVDVDEQLRLQREALEEAAEGLEGAQKDASAAHETLQTATTALSNLRTELIQLGAEIAVLGRRCEALTEQLTEELILVAYEGKLEPLPKASDNRQAHLSALTAWCERTAETLEAASSGAETALGDLDAALLRIAAEHEIAVAAGESASSALKAAEQAAREARVRAETAVSEAEKRLEERHELELSIATAQSDAALLRSLAAELRADRFVQYIIQQTLDLLAVRASEQLLKISADRYSLISHDGEFAVIDHANADETRSVKTLSGGETFLASLALALALSQHIGELATEGLGAKLEAVFIDEGFGALDPDTLEDVIDALERLRESNLMVGVITHVAALAERIRVGIRVEKGEHKSTVTDVVAT